MRAALPFATALLLVAAVPVTAGPPGDGLHVHRSQVVSGGPSYGECAAGHLSGVEASPALIPGNGPGDVQVVWQQDASHSTGPDIDVSSAGLRSTTGEVGVAACSDGGSTGEVAAAPSVATGPDGTRWVATAVTGGQRSRIVLARQRGGGAWEPQVVSTFEVDAPPLQHLPPTVAVDPQDPLTVHLAYPENHFPAGTLAVHRVSRDGGVTWSGEHPMGFGPTPLGYDFAEQLVALGGDRLLSISAEIEQADMLTLAPDYAARRDLTQAPIVHRARTSSDGGTTWSLPVTVHDLANGGVRDRERQQTALRSLVRPSVAVAPDGRVLVAGESVAADGSMTQVLLASSGDGGSTWSGQTAVTVPGVALAAAVAVDGTGRVAVSYLDLSGDVAEDDTLDGVWRLATPDERGTWVTQPLSDAFDLRALAPVYVGDQGALIGLHRGFAAATVVGTGDPDGDGKDLSDVVLTTLG